jgi:hypothetical protein
MQFPSLAPLSRTHADCAPVPGIPLHALPVTTANQSEEFLMLNAAKYLAVEVLRNGRQIEIRAVQAVNDLARDHYRCRALRPA